MSFMFTTKTFSADITFGLLKIEDGAAVVVADKEGLFKQFGIDAKIVYFNSALERDAALEANEVDCVVGDPIAAILLKSKGYNIKIISVALGINPKDGLFSFLVSPKSQIKSLEGLNNKTLAISRNSIIEYVADSILKPLNIHPKKIEIKRMPLRVEMLLNAQIDAAILPQPLSSYAQKRGAKVIFTDGMLKKSLTQTVWIANGAFLKQHSNLFKNFSKAYNEAVDRINKNPNKFKSVIIKLARVPKLIAPDYTLPHFSHIQPLSKQFYKRYIHWLIHKGLIKKPIPYTSIVYALCQ